jgi:hypothetical protein
MTDKQLVIVADVKSVISQFQRTIKLDFLVWIE